jgi:hypothetical protein
VRRSSQLDAAEACKERLVKRGWSKEAGQKRLVKRLVKRGWSKEAGQKRLVKRDWSNVAGAAEQPALLQHPRHPRRRARGNPARPPPGELLYVYRGATDAATHRGGRGALMPIMAMLPITHYGCLLLEAPEAVAAAGGASLCAVCTCDMTLPGV